MTHQDYLRRAIDEAVANVRQRRGGPFGAVVARGGEILGVGTNVVTVTFDPTAHAEIVAIRAACAAARTFSLAGATIYCSCEPCPMCLGAIYWARIGRVIYAATRDDAAAAGFDDSLIYRELALGAESRTLPSEQLLREEGGRAFAAWREWAGRVEY